MLARTAWVRLFNKQCVPARVLSRIPSAQLLRSLLAAFSLAEQSRAVLPRQLHRPGLIAARATAIQPQFLRWANQAHRPWLLAPKQFPRIAPLDLFAAA